MTPCIPQKIYILWPIYRYRYRPQKIVSVDPLLKWWLGNLRCLPNCEISVLFIFSDFRSNNYKKKNYRLERKINQERESSWDFLKSCSILFLTQMILRKCALYLLFKHIAGHRANNILISKSHQLTSKSLRDTG